MNQPCNHDEWSGFIFFKLKCLSNLLKRQASNQSEELGFTDLSQMQGCILGYLESAGEVFQKDVEKRFNMRRSTATKALQVLENNGYVLRKPSQKDARLKQILLTPKAKLVNDKVRQKIAETEKILRKGLDDQQIATFFDVAEKIIKNLKEEEKVEEKC